MEKMELDTMSIYAYCDTSHSRDRELWRGFLSYALPVVMSVSSTQIERCLAESVVYHLHELTARGGDDTDVHEAMRCISVLLAKEIGVEAEFAAASFFEGEVPTKLHTPAYKAFKKKKKGKTEDDLISAWLKRLAQIQSENSFVNKVEKWKGWLVPLENNKVG